MNHLRLLVLAIFFACNQAFDWDNQTVTIAVVEYQPVLNATLSEDERVLANAEEYVKLLDSIDVTNLDMIVYPEASLRTNRETGVEIKLEDNPCDANASYPLFMQKLSCAARKSSAYVVVNLVEKVKCDGSDQSDNCKNWGFVFYNTDVVFDRNGTIVTRYHKYNLFGEYEYNKPPTSEEVVLETDFGVKFGIFICFDILFKSPAQNLLGKKPDAIIYPSMWYSEQPFLTALQTQQMWAHAHDIHLFAAGANNPSVGSGGSGVYIGRDGSVTSGINAEGGSHVYIYESTKRETPSSKTVDALGKEMDNFTLTVDPSVIKYNSVILNVTSNDNVTEKLCYDGGEQNQLCCEFTVRTSLTETVTNNSYTYRLVAYSGVRSFGGVYNGGIEICGIIACLNSSLSSCGHRFPKYEDITWPVTFERIEIRANFEKNDNKTQFPNSLLSSIRPINASETIWEQEEVQEDGKTHIRRTFSIEQPQDRLITFAIYGRNFGQDSPPGDGNSVKSMGVSWLLITITIILSIYATK